MNSPRGSQRTPSCTSVSTVLLLFVLGFGTSTCSAQTVLATVSARYGSSATTATSRSSDSLPPTDIPIPVAHVYKGPSLLPGTTCPVNRRIGPLHYLTLHYNATIDIASRTGIRGQLVDSTHPAHTVFPEPIMVRMNDPDPLLRWTVALLGLCPGDWLTLVVPSEFAYGQSGDGKKIPGGAQLLMDLQIVAAHDDPELLYKESLNAQVLFQRMDSDQNGKVTFDEMELFLNVPVDYPNRQAFLRQHFQLSDYNRDGTVSLEEFIAILENWEGIDEL